MSKLRLTGRKAVLVGVTAAAASAAVITVAAPASAAPSQLTSCSETVRVRSQPNDTSPVIGSCQAGERVTVDGTRNGYAHLVNKRGWASLDFVRLRDSEGLGDAFDGDNNDRRKDKSCSFSDSNKYHYDGDDRYKCRNGKRDYDEDYNRRNNNDDGDNNDNNNNPLKGLLGN